MEMTSLFKPTDIAVIGMSCRFPGATGYEAFWENLKAGRSSIGEVPANRWSWSDYWGDPQTEKNKSNSKWGGFLQGVDSFDIDFFGLSVKEVERMDPQQRIMLELTWSCFEDAGIRPADMSGKKVGIFLGVFNFDYKELQERDGQLTIEAHHSTGTASAIIANRISYFFNLKGPSFPIDTACSSSLSAIHSSIQSLLHGECSMAVAGGINLLLTPTRHISFSKTGMLSPTGSCKTFDDSADGYVRGEGAGLVLLKPLQQALADKDHIYGVIKGSAVNHGGRTYSLTYPNPEAQKDVIIDAQKMAGVTPGDISYIEAHGTGTPKGDPIEFQGLTHAFLSHSPDGAAPGRENYCGLGSVKTNIGHLEAAAGVAGIIKVLLSMKYKQLPGLQNFNLLNHRISLDHSPFYMVTSLQEWKPLRDSNNLDLPRTAGVSSFGFGGTNAHVIVQEAPTLDLSRGEDDKSAPPYYLVCLSAKEGENLLQKELDLAQWLHDGNSMTPISDICKTLSIGREHFQKRTAFIVANTAELLQKLEEISKQTGSDAAFRNLHKNNKQESPSQLFTEVEKMTTASLLANRDISHEEYHRKLLVLAELYLLGIDLAWDMPWFGCNGRRIAMPAYPFTKSSYWIPELNEAPSPYAANTPAHLALQPLTGRNTSNFGGIRFSYQFTGLEFFVKDHVVNGKQILPAVAYLEMIRAGIAESIHGLGGSPGILCLKNIIWAQPILIGNNNPPIHSSLFAAENETISFEIFSEPSGPDNHPLIYSHGEAWFKDRSDSLPADPEDLKNSGGNEVLLQQDCYRILKNMGFDYGPSHQAIETLYPGTRRHLAKLSLPPAVKNTLQHFFMHPSLMDAALQAALLVDQPVREKDAIPHRYLPFALEHLEILSPCTEDMWAIIGSGPAALPGNEPVPVKRMDIDLCDSKGNICISMKGLSFKLSARTDADTLLLQPAWTEKPASAAAPSSDYRQHLVLLCEPGDLSENGRAAQLPGASFISLQSSEASAGERFQTYTARTFEEIQKLLLSRSKGKILVQIVVFESEDNTPFDGLSGLLKTARSENPDFIGQLIRVPSSEDLYLRLSENAFHTEDALIRYMDGKRHIREWKEVANNLPAAALPWQDGGVYLITGGAGGLGLIFAREIASSVKNPVLILTGRSPLDPARSALIDELRASGARVDYRQADVNDKNTTEALIRDIRKNFAALHGIIHSAGIIHDNFIIRKSKEELFSVLSPKVMGATWLDEATKEMPLDLFILFSSIVGVLGNAGQADYAAANAWLDDFAFHRNRLVTAGKRSGHTLSLDWPLWLAGGMQLEKLMERTMLEQVKMSPLETNAGIRSFYLALSLGIPQVMVTSGNLRELRAHYLNPSPMPSSLSAPAALPPADAANSRTTEKKAIAYFKELLSATIKRPVALIEADAAMEKYGIDSVMVMQLTREMEKVFGSLPKTLFFEYQNILELTRYFMENHAEKLGTMIGTEEAPRTEDPAHIAFFDQQMYRQSRFMSGLPQTRNRQPDQPEAPAALDIAIIGMAGRYPQADNLREFWNNLKNGKDCITEIPADRWDYRLYFDEDKDKEGKSYSKWGGFLHDVDKFDPLFFNISPLEAERMDPQERLFLQCVYETIEDAGYTRHSLTRQQNFGLGNQVGVYVGVMYEEYQLFGAQEALNGKPVALWGLPSSIANRVSYYFDFHGPSMAVDTMCSSSLTSIHLACESIVRGKCEVAVAGGVNVSVHPNKYIFLSQGRFASSKGRCESFGIGGDGYVPGEGVGAVLLKPLDKAIADGDHIYGVIKSTAINHGGKTNGYTVPNPKAQAGAIGRAFKEAGIDPRTLSYLEAHGTGTFLGDPIEIAGLSRVIHEYTKETQFCAIGSAKSNIGHCESAAGIAGLTKVLLQMQHGQIVPSLHSEVLNANIDFDNSPFFVQQDLSPWKRPVLEKNGEQVEYPRCAGISSFGAGGSNAHIVVQEYVPHIPAECGAFNVKKDDPVIILLSGVDEDRLTALASQLLAAIREKDRDGWRISDELLANMAYTLQVGRDHMECRLALLVTSLHDLEWKLDRFIEGTRNIEGLFLGLTSSHITAGPASPADEDLHETTRTWFSKKEYKKLLKAWVNGLKIEWSDLHKNSRLLRRISLPVYPFKKDRYWIGAMTEGKSSMSLLHPLLHENTSDLAAQRFRSRFSGSEFFLNDHRVNGKKILPAAASLEMVREAVRQSIKSFDTASSAIRIDNITWMMPMTALETGITVNIELLLEINGVIGFQLYGHDPEDAGEKEIYCTGSAGILSLPEVPAPGTAGILALQKECGGLSVSGAACYKAFEKTGLLYGPALQGLEEAYIGSHSILAKITLPAVSIDRHEDYMLHPAILDSALHASLLWDWTDGSHTPSLHLPYAVEEIGIYRKTPAMAWASIRKRENLQDIDILNENAEICIRLKGISFRSPSRSDRPAAAKTFLLIPEWKSRLIGGSSPNPFPNSATAFSRQLIVLVGFNDAGNELAARLPEAEILTAGAGTSNDFLAVSLSIFEKIRSLLKEKARGNTLVQILIRSEEEGCLYAGMSGLLKTAEKENPRFLGQVILMPAAYSTDDCIDRLLENSRTPFDKEIRYINPDREILEWTFATDMAAGSPDNRPLHLPNGSATLPWKDRAVYLITGGAGGLGFIFAAAIARKTREATLILTGRSSPDSDKLSKIAALQATGAKVFYRQMDVADAGSVERLIRSIEEEFGGLQGIIHSAGVIKDNYLVNKSTAEWNEVLSPKVKGIQYLDLASKHLPLDFFVFFSSVSGAVGNAGQGDYATANAFMDEYAGYRNALVAKGLRQGHSLSVNWPLWLDGGMHVDKATEDYLLENMGLTPLHTDAGIEALDRALSSKYSRVMVASGDREMIYDKIVLGSLPPAQDSAAPLPSPQHSIDSHTAEEAIGYFTRLLSSVIKLPVNKIRPDTPLEEYGIDSVMVMKMTAKLEKVFGPLSKTLFFEYQHIRALAGYFLEEHLPLLLTALGIREQKIPAQQPPVISQRRLSVPTPSPIRPAKSPGEKAPASFDIAIVGLAGKYPKADNLEEFWENLCQGKDCITEIPQERWDHSLYFDGDKNKTGTTYSKWGGFLNGVDEFDPLFFNISPREAELLDPQERLFLQCAYETIEDAGYSRESLSADADNGLSGNVGVYVGVMYEEYQLFGVEESMKGRNIALFGNPSSIANRVSYFYNFNGPSMAIDTMCSSSLTAIHLACQGIFNGDCKAAIAGGVNISIHPNKYLLLAQGKFISGKGRCESFGVGGDGYVPGEGVGAVLLKPLSQAMADGDHIYGVIKASSINHGGKTNGYTVPNPNAQAGVIKTAFERAGIDPRTISYLEAHGTGTSLGDPIEITGLKKAYREYTKDNNFCAIGSVKSNIGHGESAAGIAGLTKILLQLKHRLLVPSLHSEELNPNIDFENSPFVVQQHLSEWKNPVIGNNGHASLSVRRAGISSFGAGGSNAHLLIEEFPDSLPHHSLLSAPSGHEMPEEPVIILLSARNPDRLTALIQRLLKPLEKGLFSDGDLPDIAFTLQTGRDPLDLRIAMIVKTVNELISMLLAFLKGDDAIQGLFHGKAERDNGIISTFTADEELQEAVQKWIDRKKYSKLCDLWVKGLPIDWVKCNKHYASAGRSLKKVSLPTYPFERSRYWVPEGTAVTPLQKPSAREEIMLLQPFWEDSPLPASAQKPVYARHLILCIGANPDKNLDGKIAQRIPGAIVLAPAIQNSHPGESLLEYALLMSAEIRQLLKNLPGGKILVQLLVPSDHQTTTALAALLKTARLENPQFIGQLIETGNMADPESLASLLEENSRSAANAHIRYLNGRRQLSVLQVYEAPKEPAPQLWKDNGIYLITGGAGEIGLLMAKEIIRLSEKATIVMTGRSSLSGRKLDLLRSLQTKGATIVYRQADVAERGSVEQLVDGILAEFGGLTGIIHSAGVTRDSFLLHKTSDDWQNVFAPKVKGLINLDEVTKSIPLDFFIAFSSIAGLLGNAGQADYATANAFMDHYILSRNKMVSEHLRMGRSLSINWPLWKDGGMHVQKEVEDNMEKRMGILPLATDSALLAFYLAVASKSSQILIVYGEKEKINARLLKRSTPNDSPINRSAEKQRLPALSALSLQESTLQLIKTIFGQVVKISPERIDVKEEFQAYGLNSVMIVQLNQMLEKLFGELSKTLFYENRDLSSLTAYLLKDHEHTCSILAGAGAEVETNAQTTPAAPPQTGHAGQTGPIEQTSPVDRIEPIAIIGMNGRYPMAGSLQEFWENLKAGKDCISEIPGDRWSLDDFYHPDKDKAIELGKSYSKWGGFLEDFASFDPLFFSISPREAITMDPQERLFLQASWQVLEDAGYTREQIAEKFNGNVGVFAGVTKTGFELHGPALQQQGDDLLLRTSFSSVANRVSFHLNLHGPSMPIDTMCSSSLTAIHEACENLYRNTCEMAIAGGVNLYLHPSNYIGLCSQSFLSLDGKCRSFGQNGTGFVPGEGVGVVLLKRLSKAIADGDNVLAVIKGTHINHGGKTSGYTVPNPVAQAELIRKTLDKAGLHAREISYVEAHGTGTMLGDPIEITGLSRAFREDTQDAQFCAIGSVKSNIGHLEAAAGIAGITKMILQIQHGLLVPSLHAGVLNSNINFERSPFYVQQQLSPWIGPKIASISSFGAGGSNAHVIIGEYLPDNPPPEQAPLFPSNGAHSLPALIVLSAMDERRLKDHAHQLLNLVRNYGSVPAHNNLNYLADIAYTLQTGREAMDERLAIKVSSFSELQNRLEDFLSGKKDIESLYRGRSLDKKTALADFPKDLPADSTLESWMSGKQFDALLDAWVKGARIDWNKLYAGSSSHPKRPRRISLPPYPFAKTKYWLPSAPSHTEKNWLFSKEEWLLDPIAKNIDWDRSLRRYERKKICIVYTKDKDRRGLTELLGKLINTAGLLHPPDIIPLHVQEVDVQQLKMIRPDVLLFSGPEKTTDPSPEPVENDLSDVFNLSKCLMQAAWDDPIKIYYLFETTPLNERLDCEALAGLFRSAMKENNLHSWTSIRLHNVKEPAARHQLLLREWLAEDPAGPRSSLFNQILYKDGLRLRLHLVETSLPPSPAPAFRQKGTYIVAGGMGYIGGSLLQVLAKKYQATLVILSKGRYDDARKQQCEQLELAGAAVYYHTADITDLTGLQLVYDRIKQEVGPIHGVINLARAHDSKSIAAKTWESFYKVSLVKIKGTLNLDKLTENDKLDFFMLFASIGAYGARGDSDYAFSVAFQNAFAKYRNLLKKDGRRSGTAVSQCWGPWEEDKLFPESRKKMKPLGLDLINMQSAFPWIEASAACEHSVIGLCAVLDRETVKETLGMKEQPANANGPSPADKTELLVRRWEEQKAKGRTINIADVRNDISVEEMRKMDISMVERIYKLCFEEEEEIEEVVVEMNAGSSENIGLIRELAMQVLQVENIDNEKPLQDYGLDSIMAMRLSTILEKKLQREVRPNLLLEFPTVKELSQHLNNTNKSVLI